MCRDHINFHDFYEHVHFKFIVVFNSTKIVHVLFSSQTSSGASTSQAAAIVRNATGLNPNEFVEKFGSRVKQLNPRYQQSQGGGTKSLTDSLPSKDVVSHVPKDRPFVSTQGGTKWHRIQKITAMSTDLQVWKRVLFGVFLHVGVILIKDTCQLVMRKLYLEP